MAQTAERTDPKLWDKVKTRVQRGDKGGKPGQWSARKAQLAVHEYKAQGGDYRGKKTADNHLAQWTREDWGTKSGRDSAETGERYLPKRAREKLTGQEYRRSSDKKRADIRRGRQFSAQPRDVGAKAADARLETMPVAVLRRKAAADEIAGRSTMRKAELIAALQKA